MCIRDRVDLIKSTMASLQIKPPPWVRKMQQVQRIQQLMAHGAPATSSGDGGEGEASSGLSAQWAAHVQHSAGPGGLLLTPDAVANASPLLAMPAASTSAAASSLSGVSGAPKRVSAKQLAAERRALRAQAKAERDAAAAAAAPAGDAAPAEREV